MNEMLLIEMFGEIDPVLLENNIIEKDIKKGRLSLFRRLFMKSKWNEDNDTPLDKSYKDITMEEHEPLSMDTTESMESDTNCMEFNTLVCDNKVIIDDLQIEDFNSLFNISIFKKSFKNLIKVISGIAIAIVVLLGVIVFIVKLVLKKDKFSSFIRRKIQVSY